MCVCVCVCVCVHPATSRWSIVISFFPDFLKLCKALHDDSSIICHTQKKARWEDGKEVVWNAFRAMIRDTDEV